MGIVNVTPDSFSDGGRFADVEQAVAHGRRLADEGADWLDVGGESTRPGAAPVSTAEEIARVVPVIAALHETCPGVGLSVDTSKAAVAEAAIEVGAMLVNDVTAFGDPGMAPLCAACDVQVVLMHMRGTPRTMQVDTTYDDLVTEVEHYLAARAEHGIRYGIRPERVLVDPGLGFGKAALDNLVLIRAVPRLKALGYRVVIGASRKSFIGRITGVKPPSERVFGSIGAALAAADRGADLLRVHDVAATRQALAVYRAVEER